MKDPWILPSPSPSNGPLEMDVSLPVAMIAYQVNLDCIAEPSPSSSQMEEEDPYAFPSWVVSSSHSQDFLNDIFPSDGTILEAMFGLEQTWGELHHRSYCLPKLDDIECDDFQEIFSEKIGRPVGPIRLS